MVDHGKYLRGALLVLALLLLGGCAAKGPDGVVIHSGFYIDANLGFAIEHPQNWRRVPSDSRQKPAIVTWSPEKGAEGLALSVTTFAPEEAVGGFDSLFERFRQQEPAFNVSGEKEDAIPGLAARQVSGSTPTRTWLLLLVTARRHAYILAASAPPEHFEANRELFSDLLESFRTLE